MCRSSQEPLTTLSDFEGIDDELATAAAAFAGISV